MNQLRLFQSPAAKVKPLPEAVRREVLERVSVAKHNGRLSGQRMMRIAHLEPEMMGSMLSLRSPPPKNSSTNSQENDTSNSAQTQ